MMKTMPLKKTGANLSLTGKVMLMSTYEEFMIILTTGLLIVAILNPKNKK